jgi:hypothetical protein
VCQGSTKLQQNLTPLSELSTDIALDVLSLAMERVSQMVIVFAVTEFSFPDSYYDKLVSSSKLYAKRFISFSTLGSSWPISLRMAIGCGRKQQYVQGGPLIFYRCIPSKRGRSLSRYSMVEQLRRCHIEGHSHWLEFGVRRYLRRFWWR